MVMVGVTVGVTADTDTVVAGTTAAAAAGTPVAPGAGTATTAVDCGTVYPEIVLGLEGARTGPEFDANVLKCYDVAPGEAGATVSWARGAGVGIAVVAFGAYYLYSIRLL